MCADYSAGLVVEKFPDHDNFMSVALKVDDSVPGAERLVRPPDVFEGRSDARVVIRMLMGQHEAGCRVRGTGLIPVHLFDLGRPVPFLVVKVEAK